MFLTKKWFKDWVNTNIGATEDGPTYTLFTWFRGKPSTIIDRLKRLENEHRDLLDKHEMLIAKLGLEYKIEKKHYVKKRTK